MRLDRNHPEMDLGLDIPEQNGLDDELFFTAGPFRCSGHPTDREDVIAWCREAAKGILSGSCRIVVHYRGRRAVGSELQHGSSCRP